MNNLDDIILCGGKYYKFINEPNRYCILDTIEELISDEMIRDKCFSQLAHTHTRLTDSFESCHWHLSHAQLKKAPKYQYELKILIADIFSSMNFAIFDEKLNIVEIPCNFKIAQCGQYKYNDDITSENNTRLYGLAEVHRCITNELCNNKRINTFI
jgi:hypothetical protein